MMGTKLPNWRDDATVVEKRAKVAALHGEMAAVQARIREALAAARLAEASYTIAEGGTTDANGLMAAWNVLEGARQDVERVRAESASYYQSVATAEAALLDAETAAKEKATKELRSLYVQAADRMEKALEEAVAADQAVRALWKAIDDQLDGTRPGGMGSLAWRWSDLTPEALASWRAWRTETGVDSVRKRAGDFLRAVGE